MKCTWKKSITQINQTHYKTQNSIKHTTKPKTHYKNQSNTLQNPTLPNWNNDTSWTYNSAKSHHTPFTPEKGCRTNLTALYNYKSSDPKYLFLTMRYKSFGCKTLGNQLKMSLPTVHRSSRAFRAVRSNLQVECKGSKCPNMQYSSVVYCRRIPKDEQKERKKE